MAFVNLLNGSYSGVMGQTVGVKHKKKPVVRSRVFSKAPMTEAQKTALDKYTVYNQKISPIIRVLLDSGAVKDKSATAWAYYRRLFKYAMVGKSDYKSQIWLYPPTDPYIVDGSICRMPYPDGSYSKMSIYFQSNLSELDIKFNYWLLVKFYPETLGVDTNYTDFYCLKLNEDRTITLPQGMTTDYSCGTDGILFEPRGKYLRIIDSWDYMDNNGR